MGNMRSTLILIAATCLVGIANRLRVIPAALGIGINVVLIALMIINIVMLLRKEKRS